MMNSGSDHCQRTAIRTSAELEDRYGIAATTDNKAAVAGADIVVLAVKPQVLPSVMGELKGTIEPRPSSSLSWLGCPSLR